MSGAQRYVFLVLVSLNVVLWVGAVVWPEHSEPSSLSLAVGLSPGVEPLILARDTGQVTRSEVNYVEMNWASAAMRALRNLVVDAAVLSLDEVVRQSDFGSDLRIVLVTDVSRGADALLAQPGIKGVADLRGHRVGYELRSSGAFLLSSALHGGGLQIADVETVPLNAAEMAEAFSLGDVDVVVAAEPFRTHVLKSGAVEIYNSTRVGEDLCHVLVVREEKLAEHRSALLRLARAHFECLALLTGGTEHVDAALRREELTLDEFNKVLERVRFPTLEENRELIGGPNPKLAEMISRVAAAIHEEGAIGSSFDPVGLLDPVLVEGLQ